MKKYLLGVALITALFISGCSSDEKPSELDMLIEQLQTSQITSETVPEETSEDITTPENTEETSDKPDDVSDSVTYDSVTVTVLSVEEDHISVESGGVIYNIFIDENTRIFGGDISEMKTVTITYAMTNNGTSADITASFITVLSEDESTAQE